MVLWEGYTTHFEGRPAAVSTNGWVLKTPYLRGQRAQPGDVVSILAAPSGGSSLVGTWYRIAQRIDDTTYLMADSLPTALASSTADYVLSINRGYVNETISHNTIDLTTNSSLMSGDTAIVVASSSFGMKVLANTVKGRHGIDIQSSGTQETDGTNPTPWGWSHSPVLDLLVDGNTIQDATEAVSLLIEHSPHTFASSGRTYLKGTFTRNAMLWSSSAPTAQVGVSGYTTQGWITPKEIMLTTVDSSQQGNWARGPSGATLNLSEYAAWIDEANAVAASSALPSSPQVGPTKPIVSPAGSNALALTWGMLGGATGYKVEHNDGGGWVQIASVAASVTSLTDTGLTAGTAYSYRVRATTSAAGDSPYSATGSATTTGGSSYTGVVLTTLNQDGSDRIGREANSTGQDGYQDIHFHLTGLPGPTITAVEVKDSGAGVWQLNSTNRWKVVVDQTSGGTVGDLYFEPYRDEHGSGGVFSVSITFASGSPLTLTRNISGVLADAGLPVTSAISLGQDDHDLIGEGSGSTTGDTYQDIRIALAGLPSYKTIDWVDITGDGGGEWQANGPGMTWKALRVQPTGASAADLYIPPYQNETGRKFFITVHYADSSTTTVEALNVQAVYHLARTAAAALGQDGHDLIGEGPDTTGADGNQDIHIALTGLPPKAISWIDVRGAGGGEWEYNGQDHIYKAELVRTGNATTADLYVPPYQVENTGRYFSITVYFADGTAIRDVIASGIQADYELLVAATTSLDQDNSDETGTTLANPPTGNSKQDVHVRLYGVPSYKTVSKIEVSNGAGVWDNDYGTSHWKIKVAAGPDPYSRNLYFEPYQNEVDSTFTVTVLFTDGTTLVQANGTSGIPILDVDADNQLVLRSASASQDGSDYAKGDNVVGSDTYRDVHIVLVGLPTYRQIDHILIQRPNGATWTTVEHGSNWAAKFSRRPSQTTTVDLYFQPSQNETGTDFTIWVYFVGMTDPVEIHVSVTAQYNLSV